MDTTERTRGRTRPCREDKIHKNMERQGLGKVRRIEVRRKGKGPKSQERARLEDTVRIPGGIKQPRLNGNGMLQVQSANASAVR